MQTAISHRCLSLLVPFIVLVTYLPVSASAPSAVPAHAAPSTSHPRLWITPDDLPRLRGWATDANPVYRDGLSVLAANMKADMDAGRVPGQDGGDPLWEEFPTESYAELFAFMSLIDPDEAARQDYAQRARSLLMDVINAAAQGQADGEPFRAPDFATNDRSRWWGECFGLTVDWIYPVLTPEDKATIREVFLRWADEIQTTGYHRPGYYDDSLIGLTNDPALLRDRTAVRWAGNNYFTGNMRNLGLMAMALDLADDPGGELASYLDIATGAYLYMTDDLFRTDSAGGLAPEGFEYSPQSVGYVSEFLLALHTAGQNDPAVRGPQVVLTDNPFWNELIPAYLNSLSPAPAIIPGEEYRGPIYQPAWYGDGNTYWSPDFIEAFGSLGRYDDLTGNTQRLDAIRWIETNLSPGGAEAMIPERIAEADGNSLLNAILYFLILDPSAAPPTDPRPDTPSVVFAPGAGRLLARTGWDEDATWFTYALTWNAIDHQHGNGNAFELYRDGEWLTKVLVGYGASYADDDPSDDYFFPSSEYNNTLALENDAPLYNDPASDRPHQIWLRGSQWEQEPAGDPTILALSVAPGYAYALGDATNLYNSTYQESTDILTASRSVVWLAPDVIVVYDRATSQTDGRFKRFWLNLPADATVDGDQTTMTTAGGQQLVITTLLPSDATPTVQPLDIQTDDLANGEPMRYRFLVEAPGGPRETRFLNVLQAADAGAGVGQVNQLESDDGAFTGTIVGTTAVLFPVTIGAEVTSLRYTVPATVTAQLVTGLTPGAAYDVSTTPAGDSLDITITPGGTQQADAGGVLLIGSLPAALDATFAFTNVPAPVATASPTTEITESATSTSGEPSTPELLDSGVPSGPPRLPDTSEGGPAATGEVVYSTYDGRLFRVAAEQGATPEDLGPALDALSPAPEPDDAVNISPDGAELLLTTQRFDPDCAGWACLAVVPADLSSGEAIKANGSVIHPDGFAAIAGDTVVYADDGGPHQLDLWATTRGKDGWSIPILLTADSPYDYQDYPSLSADGSKLLFDCSDVLYAGPGTAICEVASDGSGFRVVLTPDADPDAAAASPDQGALHRPSYAPDGGVIFEADWAAESIWRLPAGATVPEAVDPAVNNDNAPCVLPDGRIASLWLERPGGTSLHELKVVTANGSSYVMLATNVDVVDIACGA